MHELAVCQALLEHVEAVAREHAATEVHNVVIRIGPLSGVEPDLLQQAYLVARAGGVASRAELIIETGPVRIRCRSCDAEADVPANRLVCPACGDWHTHLLAGDELLLARLELQAGPTEH